MYDVNGHRKEKRQQLVWKAEAVDKLKKRMKGRREEIKKDDEGRRK